MNRRIVQLVSCIIFICVAVSAQAAGFAMYEFSARGNALGGTMVARDADVSSQAFNPALVSQIPETRVMTGVTAIRPSASVELEDFGTTEGESSTWFIPHAYFSTPLNDRVTLGISSFSRFGLGTEYDENWVGKADLVKVGIRSLSVNPVLGIKLTDTLSIGGGVEMMWFDFEQERHPTVAGSTHKLKMGGDSVAPGVNFGVHYKPLEWLALGASWRSVVRHKLKGKTQTSTALPNLFPETGATGDVTLPEQYAFALCVTPFENLSIEAGAMYVGWSSYKRLRIEYDKPFGMSSSSNKTTRYKDVWRYSLGAEYSLNDDWALRAGYVYDNSPLNDNHLDFMVPANDRQLYSLGVGWTPGNWSFDVSYTYLDIKDRNGKVEMAEHGTQEATFKDGDAHLVGVSLGYTF